MGDPSLGCSWSQFTAATVGPGQRYMMLRWASQAANTWGVSLPAFDDFCGSCVFRWRLRFLCMASMRKGGGSGPGHASALCKRGSPFPNGRKALEETSGIRVLFPPQSTSSLIQWPWKSKTCPVSVFLRSKYFKHWVYLAAAEDFEFCAVFQGCVCCQNDGVLQ